jgi:hypothetical protein
MGCEICDVLGRIVAIWRCEYALKKAGRGEARDDTFAVQRLLLKPMDGIKNNR